MEALEQIWKRLKDSGYETDKGSIHSYIPVYEKLLAPYREAALNVLEIGCFNGASIRMWSEYFTQANIHGVDCSLTPHDSMADLRPLINERNSHRINGGNLSRVDIHILDAENTTVVSKCFQDIKFDVIIEDAGHEINQQINLYRIWKNYLAEGGIYIIEDVQDIDKDWNRFEELKQYFWCEDLRRAKGRYDDVLIVIK